MTRGIAVLGAALALICAPGTAAAADGPVTVTMVTGDRVTVTPSSTGRPDVAFDPAPGSEPTGFDVLRDGSHVHVIPDDVAALVPEVLDPSLFDVTALAEMGYDDTRADELPLIVRRAAGVQAVGSGSPLRSQATLESIDATAVTLDKDDADDLGEDLAAIKRPDPRAARAALAGVTRIWLDRSVEANELDGYLSQVKAPAAWGSGLDGAGVTVAVLDTGVDDGHPALAGQVDGQANFTDAASPADGNGHGTHVASLIAGTGAGSGGARQGIATGADLLSGKVLRDDSRGQESWVIAGMEWATAQGADVVNLSLGGPPGPDGPLVQSLDNLTARTGALFVVAAGNSGGLGASPYTIEVPGSAASALTVGAALPSDAIAVFSSEGPTLGTYRLKPDVTAPGVAILGARAGARDDDLYVPMNGTSQATPIVAGAAALLLQQHPDWDWQRVKSQVVGTADPHPTQSSWSQGGGRLDLDQATHQELTADTATLGFGYVRHPDDAPQTRTVTLTNDGNAAVSLEISDEVRNDAGVVAPDAALVANPATLTVPAGGTATTNVTLDPGLIEDGLWHGAMSFAAGGNSLVRLPFGVYDEPERYDLDIRMLNRNGDPYDPATGADDPNGDTTIPIFNGDTGSFYRLRPDAGGHASARVEPGSYMVFGRIVTPAAGDMRETFTIAGTPSLEVRSDTSYVIDAREAQRLRPPVVEGLQTDPELAVGTTYSRHAGTRGYTEFGFFDPQEVADGRVYVTPTGTARTGTFETTFRWRLVPTGPVEPRSPDAYELLFNAPRFPDPLSPSLSRGDVARLARVDTTYRPAGPPGEQLAGTLYKTVETGVGFVFRTTQRNPGTTRRLMTAAPDVLWGHCLAVSENASRELCDEPAPYPPRERDAVQFGAALHPEAWAARHSPTSMYFQTGLSDGEHRSVLHPDAAESSRLTLFRDGELVGTQNAVAGFFGVPNAPGRFRLEQDWTLRDVFWRSRVARTVWTFDSAPPADPSQGGSTTAPFLTLDYGADVDGLGRAAPLQPLRLDLGVGHVAGAIAPDRIVALRLRWSVDGGDTWHPAETERTGSSSFRGRVPGAVLRSGRRLSLRVVAEDAARNEIDQTVSGIIPVG